MNVKLDFIKNFNVKINGFDNIEDFFNKQDNIRISELFDGNMFPEYEEISNIYTNPNEIVKYIISEISSGEYYNLEDEIISYGEILMESEDGNITIYKHPILGNCILVDFDNPGIILTL